MLYTLLGHVPEEPDYQCHYTDNQNHDCSKADVGAILIRSESHIYLFAFERFHSEKEMQHQG